MVPSRNPDLPQAVKHGAAAGSLDCTHGRSLQQRGGEALQLHAAGRVGQSAPWAGLLLRQRAPKHLPPPTAALADTPWGALLPARRRLARLLQPAKDEGVTCCSVSVSIRQPDGDGDRQCSSGLRAGSEHAADAGQAAAHGILSQPPKLAMTTAGAGSAHGPQAPVSHASSLQRITGGNTSGSSSSSSSPSQQCQCASTTVGACAVAAPLFPTASRTAFLPGAPYGSSVSQHPQALSTAPLGAGAVDSAIAPTPVVSARAASCCSVSQQRVTAAGPVAARGLSLASATVIASTAVAASSHCSRSIAQHLGAATGAAGVGVLGSARASIGSSALAAALSSSSSHQAQAAPAASSAAACAAGAIRTAISKTTITIGSCSTFQLDAATAAASVCALAADGNSAPTYAAGVSASTLGRCNGQLQLPAACDAAVGTWATASPPAYPSVASLWSVAVLADAAPTSSSPAVSLPSPGACSSPAPERAAPWVMGAAPHATAAASSSASSCCSPAASSTTLARASAAYAATLPASASAATGVPVHSLCSHPWSTPTAIAPSGAGAGRAAFRPLVCGGFSTPVCSSAGGWQGPMGGSVGKRGTTRLRAGNQRARACASAA